MLARILLLAIAVAFSSSLPAAQRPFVVFDGLQYSGKPDTTARGMVPITWVGDLWRPGVSKDSVDAVRINAIFAHLANPRGYYYLDIENWPLDRSPDEREASMAKLSQVLDLARRTAPDARIGFYGLLPGIVYWPLIRHDRAYDQWLATNRRLDDLAQRVDAVFPSLYTFYEDVEAWKSYARQTLVEARRYRKPVYAFLWPEYHDSTVLRGQLVPLPYWRAQLELCSELADGVVLWGGWGQRWNEDAAWWQESVGFAQRLRDAGRLAVPSGT
jgi:hypothetical protein